jgi:hypothetical protein
MGEASVRSSRCAAMWCRKLVSDGPGRLGRTSRVRPCPPGVCPHTGGRVVERFPGTRNFQERAPRPVLQTGSGTAS